MRSLPFSRSGITVESEIASCGRGSVERRKMGNGRGRHGARFVDGGKNGDSPLFPRGDECRRSFAKDCVRLGTEWTVPIFRDFEHAGTTGGARHKTHFHHPWKRRLKPSCKLQL